MARQDILASDTLDVSRPKLNEMFLELYNRPGAKSAYQVAVDAGFEGTEGEWLQSLVGESPEVQVVSELPATPDENTFYVVPGEATGPLVEVVSEPPASPVEGTFYVIPEV